MRSGMRSATTACQGVGRMLWRTALRQYHEVELIDAAVRCTAYVQGSFIAHA